MAGMQSQLDEAKSRVDSMQGQVSSLQVSGGKEGGREGGREEEHVVMLCDLPSA